MEQVVRAFSLFPGAGVIALIFAVAGSVAMAQDGSFIVSQHGQQVGTASFHFAPVADGYNSSALVQVKMEGLDYSISKSEELTSANELKHVVLSALVNNSAVTVTAKPDAAQLLMNISANGRSSTARLDGHPGAVFLADFDPGALETLLTLAVTHGNRDLWAIVPKNAGSVAAVSLATYADEQGTLDGKPIAVHHLVATISGGRTELFAGPENQLLQAELPQEGFALVRKGFVLKPPAKPIAPAE